MSYVALKPRYYQMLNPESPWHPGAPGWSTAPVPGWGENPALVGPPRLAVEGLGEGAACDCADTQRSSTKGFLLGVFVGGAMVFLLKAT